MPESYTVFTLGQLTSTTDIEETLLVSEKGRASSTSIPVPSRTSLVITDIDVAAGGNVGMFRLKQTNDGTTYFTLGALQVTGLGIGTWVTASPNLAWMIEGGPNVQLALTVETPSGPIPITCVMTGYRKI